MKNFSNVKMTLFDSTNAYFKVAVEAQFTRKNPDGSYRDLVYTTDKGTSVLNPNIYLTLSYKDDNMNAVYTSYPQLFAIRGALEKIKDMLISGDAFILDPNDNSLSLKQNYADSIVLDNIGKGNNWIEFKLCVIKTGENGVYQYAPGVSIQLSTSNGYVSQLSQEEFYTVYTIIKDLNLTNIQCMLSLGFLNCDKPVYNGGYVQQPAGYYGATNPGYVPQNNGYQAPQQGYQQPMNNGYAQQPQQTTYMKPRYNNQQRQPSYRTQTPPPPVNNNNNMAAQHPVENPYPDNTQYMSQQTTTQPMTNNLPPRNAGRPVMNMHAVEETPVSSYDIDDTAALDSIFNN